MPRANLPLWIKIPLKNVSSNLDSWQDLIFMSRFDIRGKLDVYRKIYVHERFRFMGRLTFTERFYVHGKIDVHERFRFM